MKAFYGFHMKNIQKTMQTKIKKSANRLLKLQGNFLNGGSESKKSDSPFTV